MHAASRDGEDRSSRFWCASLRGATSLLKAQEKEARGQRRELKGPRETKRTGTNQRGTPFGLNVHYRKMFQLPSDLSYTHSAWQKFRHRLGSFLQPAARRDEAWRGEVGGGGGARVDIPLVLMLVQVGKESPL